MAPKRFHIIPLGLFLLGFGLFQQSGEAALTFHDSLGFSLLPGSNSSPVSYYVVRRYDDPARVMSAQNISKSEFIGIAYGWGESSANPKAEDLFSKYEVAHCGYVPDTVILHVLYKGGLGCSPIDDLWRLRYNTYPFGAGTPSYDPRKPTSVLNASGPGPGWAHDVSKPSDGQIEILKHYGTTFYIDIIYGENAFHLLHDMQDPSWVATYVGS